MFHHHETWNRSIVRFSIGPLVASLFLYNKIEKFGNVNYEFSVGLAMWAVALWISLRRSTPLMRGSASTVCVVALFFCHLEGLAIYAIAVACLELEYLWSRRSRADLAALALPFVVALLLLQLGPISDAPVLPTRWGGLEAPVQGIRSTLFAYYWQLDVIALGVIAGGLVWLLWRGVLRIPNYAWAFALVGTGLFAVMPNESMSAWGAAVRLPIGLLFMLIGMLRWEFGTRRLELAFLVVLILVTSLRSAATAHAYHEYDLLRRDVEKSLPFVAPGSRVLVAREWQNGVSALSAIQQLPCLVIIERSSLESLAYSHPLQQVLVVKQPHRASAGGFKRRSRSARRVTRTVPATAEGWILF